MRIEDLSTAPLGVAHAEAAQRLSAEAGWNQTAADWRLMIGRTEAWGRFSPQGELVATALLLPYGDQIAWLSMVLVTQPWRRRGIGSAMLSHALERCDELGITAGLDATPDGRRVYQPHGFADLFALHRLRCARPRLRVVEVDHVPIRALGIAELKRVIEQDAEVFGAPRPETVRYLRDAAPDRALVAKSAGRLLGFALARPGHHALHVGPVSAVRTEVAQALVSRAIEGTEGPISIDVPDAQDRFQAWLESVGFVTVRPFTRMLRGAASLGDPTRTFAVAGPEFG